MSDLLREMDHGPAALPAGSSITLFNCSSTPEALAAHQAAQQARGAPARKAPLVVVCLQLHGHMSTLMLLCTGLAASRTKLQLHALHDLTGNVPCSVAKAVYWRIEKELHCERGLCWCGRLRNLDVTMVSGNPMDYDELTSKIDVTTCAHALAL